MEANEVKQIVWAQSALRGLQHIYEFIYSHSPQNASRIIDEIARKVSELKDHPGRYKPDGYKRNNNGGYRAFEHKKIRVSYKVTDKRIEIVRVKHTKQKPRQY